jgi:hypothetical protein
LFASVLPARAQCVSSRELLDCCSAFEVKETYDDINPDSGAAERCLQRPDGTICVGFPDRYIWLLPATRFNMAQAHCDRGTVYLAYALDPDAWAGALYLHPADSDEAKVLEPCADQGSLDPRACSVDVSIAEPDPDGGAKWVPADRLVFDDADTEPDDAMDGGSRDVSDASTSTQQSPSSRTHRAADSSDGGCSVGPVRGASRLSTLFAVLTLCVVIRYRRSKREGR